MLFEVLREKTSVKFSLSLKNIKKQKEKIERIKLSINFSKSHENAKKPDCFWTSQKLEKKKKIETFTLA